MAATTRSNQLSGRKKRREPSPSSDSISASNSSGSLSSDEESPPPERPRPGGRGYSDPAIKRVLCFCRMCQGVLKKMPRTMRGHMRKWGPFDPKEAGQSSKSHSKHKKQKVVEEEPSLPTSHMKFEEKQKVEKLDRTRVNSAASQEKAMSYCSCLKCHGYLLMTPETSTAHIIKWGSFLQPLSKYNRFRIRKENVRIRDQRSVMMKVMDQASCEEAYTSIVDHFFSELERPFCAAWSKAFGPFCSSMWDEVYIPRIEALSHAQTRKKNGEHGTPVSDPNAVPVPVEAVTRNAGSDVSGQSSPAASHQNGEYQKNDRRTQDLLIGTHLHTGSRDTFELIWADEWNRKWEKAFELFKKSMVSTQEEKEKIISALPVAVEVTGLHPSSGQLPCQTAASPVQMSAPRKQDEHVDSDASHVITAGLLSSQHEKLTNELNMVRSKLQSEQNNSSLLRELVTVVKSQLKSVEERHDKVVQDLEMEKEKVLSLQEMHWRTARDLEEEKEKSLCQICMERPRDTCILPCLHLSYCSQCVVKHHRSNKTCPACRTPSSGFLVTSLYSVK